MMGSLYPLVRPLLFTLDPERAHRVTLATLEFVRRLGLLRHSRDIDSTPVQCMGLTFPNRIGLAAGLDKDGRYIDALGALGFGFIEVGTVTPRPQPGQPRPRLAREPSLYALVNRMGFPNAGVHALKARLAQCQFRGIRGVNIGKNADTPLDVAVQDYALCARELAAHADYLAINVSSPNSPGLRELQRPEQLASIIEAVTREARDVATGRTVPILVKVSPDLDRGALERLAAVLLECKVAGVIATNTTVQRPVPVATTWPGSGLSGEPLLPLALETVATLRSLLGPGVTIIGVSGVTSPEAALAMRRAGADLVQLYTGLVYRGPGLISSVLAAMSDGTTST